MRPGWKSSLVRGAVHVPVAAAIAFYFVRFALLSVQAQDAYLAPGYDMGIFDQGVWLLSRFRAPFVTVMGRDLFGDHTSFVVLLIVPFYRLWPHVQLLLVIQAGLLAAAAIPVYLLARRRTGSTAVGTGLAVAYLLNPALEHGNLEQFHPEAFLVLFVSLAIYWALEWHPRLFIAAVVGCLLVKEDTALLIVPLALLVAWRRDRRLGLWLAAGAVGYAFFATQVVIRLLLGTSSFYANRIPFGGIKGVLLAPFAHPGKFWSYALSGHRPFYVWQMGISFGWAFLIAPELAAVGVLTLAENVLSTFPYMQQILYHYSLALVPVLAMGTAYAISRLTSPRLRAATTAYVVGAATVACLVWGLAFTAAVPATRSPSVRETNRVLTAVPADAVVSAGQMYVSHLDHRNRIFEWPTPFRARYWGLLNHEGQTLPFAGTVEYLVLPSQLRGSDASTFASISGQFRLVATGGGTSVYRRVGTG